MFFASIAFVLISISGMAVRSVPVGSIHPRQASIDSRPHACTGAKGTGICFPLLASGATQDEGECNNIVGIKSLVFPDINEECIGFTSPDCQLDGIPPREFFNINSDDLPADVKSLSCT
ncbi:hypothetical protein DFH09DRAFT_1077847 [Mycena vulgaris]|nr:hypothetical protein DFH09DRAFT_1077847 [Mycena vulgaris]